MTAVPVHEGLFTTVGRSVQLIGGRCASTGALHFPRPTVCPSCPDDDIEEARFGARGKLWGWTAVTAAPPGYHGPVPYGVGVVEVAEGLRVVTRLTEDDPARLRFGQAMRLVLDVVAVDDESGDEIVSWAYTPERRRRKPAAPRIEAGVGASPGIVPADAEGDAPSDDLDDDEAHDELDLPGVPSDDAPGGGGGAT